MIHIFIEVNGEEYNFSFTKLVSPNQNATRWGGDLAQIGLVGRITFTEVGGMLTNLQATPAGVATIGTSYEVLTERFINAIEKLSENEGFEPTEGNEEKPVISDPYNPDDIKVRRDVYSISDIQRKIRGGDIDLNPDFQRNLVWDSVRKSLLIESILLGIPLPMFYFAQEKDGSFFVVDGLQRLSTIRDFLNNQFSLRNLEHLGATCNGKYYEADGRERKVKEDKALAKHLRRRLEDTQLNVNVIEASSPAKVKYDIFRRINEGGKPLNQQEIRNCLAKPHVRKFMKDMSSLDSFVLASGGKIGFEPGVNDRRMAAQELVLRFTGFYIGLPYPGNMNDFLDRTLESLNGKSEKEMMQVAHAFDVAMKNCYHLFGRYCFRKYLPDQLDNPSKQLFNKSLYLTWSIAFANIPHEFVKSKMPFEGFAPVLAQKLQEDTEYFQAVTNKTSDRTILDVAFSKAKELVAEHFSQSVAQ